MAKIKVISKCELFDGMSITFRAPCDCTAVDGLNVYYNEYSQSFSFRDAHGNNLAGLDHLFTEGAYIKAILDTGRGYAFLQNADTSTYIENDFKNNFYLKEDSLADVTKSMFGLGATATPNTVFQKLAMPYGYYGFDITVQLTDGTPVPYVILNGLEDFAGNTPVTDENGRYSVAVSKLETPTLTINEHIGIVNYETTLTANSEYVFTPIMITVQIDESPRLLESTGSYQIFAPNNALVDICTIGGGGGGGRGTEDSFGGGGGGGYCTNLLNVATIKTGSLDVVIGSGGSGGSSSKGGKGGTTSVSYGGETILSADGGDGGDGRITDDNPGGGGAGNGGGGSYRAGSGGNATVYLFEDEALGLPGGGGGGGGSSWSYGNSDEDYVTLDGGAGGRPYGGHGGYRNITSGQGPGGGGGGGQRVNGGSGYKGAAYVRVRYVS